MLSQLPTIVSLPLLSYAESLRLPLAQQDTSQRGDMVTFASGVLCKRDHLDPNRSFNHNARHCPSDHGLYKQIYNALCCAFGPLVANSLGQFGPELLSFL